MTKVYITFADRNEKTENHKNERPTGSHLVPDDVLAEPILLLLWWDSWLLCSALIRSVDPQVVDECLASIIVSVDQVGASAVIADTRTVRTGCLWRKPERKFLG